MQITVGLVRDEYGLIMCRIVAQGQRVNRYLLYTHVDCQILRISDFRSRFMLELIGWHFIVTIKSHFKVHFIELM